MKIMSFLSPVGAEVSMWRRAWRDKILPAVADFRPDFIIISAGFDAHKKDELNYRYIGITERDYYWLTQQLVSLANKVCEGRIVSALEGGYRIQGGIVSAFSRSVAAHVRALNEVNLRVRASRTVFLAKLSMLPCSLVIFNPWSTPHSLEHSIGV